ncbi:MAG: FecR domain-containing protein [Pseudomonadota bacterium]
MSCNYKNSTGRKPVVRALAGLWFALAALLAAPAALAIDSGDIVVVSLKGEIHVTMNGAVRNLRAGGVLELPASIRTGSDGNIELRQGATTVSVGPETLLEFPALEQRGAPIDRIVQPRGNVFYSIGKREGRKLRVETPYLVGVIKGTQFNVAVQDEAATISLFEGLLEVRASDDSDVIDLRAGEIAARKRGDKSIGVMKMDDTKASAPRRQGSVSTNETPVPTALRVKPSGDGAETLLVERVGDVVADFGTVADATAAVGTTTAEVAINTVASGLDAETGAHVDTVAASVDAGATDNVGSGSLDLSTNISSTAGPVTVDTGAAADAGTGTVDIAANTNVDTGPLTTDVTATTAVNIVEGTVGATADVVAAAPLAQVDVGANVAVDVTAGVVNLGVDVAGVDVNVGVDLGLDDNDNRGPGNASDDSSNSGQGSDNKGPGNNNVGELLDSLLRRPKKK